MKRLSVILVAFMLVATSVQAADISIGYVDLQKALSLSAAGQAAKGKMETEIAGVEDQVKQRQGDLQALQESLKKQMGMLSESAREEKQIEFEQQVRDYQRYVKDKQDEMKAREERYTQQILRDLGQQVVALSEKEKISIMMEKSQLVYADAALDYTDKLIDMYNKEYKNNH
ncbi:MAG: OmpH family outer membrane protein [Desulfuromonadaceae bacterium]|nr:OmpH family outer membrane protein [Desulfuromonadaceae bacterium]